MSDLLRPVLGEILDGWTDLSQSQKLYPTFDLNYKKLKVIITTSNQYRIKANVNGWYKFTTLTNAVDLKHLITRQVNVFPLSEFCLLNKYTAGVVENVDIDFRLSSFAFKPLEFVQSNEKLTGSLFIHLFLLFFFLFPRFVFFCFILCFSFWSSLCVSCCGFARGGSDTYV